MRRFLRVGIPLAVVTAGAAVLLLTQPWGDDVAESNVRTHRFCNVSIDVPADPNIDVVFVPRFMVSLRSRFVMQTPGLADIVLKSDPAKAQQFAAEALNDPSSLTDELEDNLDTVVSIGFTTRHDVKLPTGEVVRPFYSEMLVDAQTGEILLLIAANPDEEAVLSRSARPQYLRVLPVEAAHAFWPHAESAVALPDRKRVGALSYQPPHPDSGINVQYIESFPGDISDTLIVENCRSYQVINARTTKTADGKVVTSIEEGQQRIHPDDATAFGRVSREVTIDSDGGADTLTFPTTGVR